MNIIKKTFFVTVLMFVVFAKPLCSFEMNKVNDTATKTGTFVENLTSTLNNSSWESEYHYEQEFKKLVLVCVNNMLDFSFDAFKCAKLGFGLNKIIDGIKPKWNEVVNEVLNSSDDGNFSSSQIQLITEYVTDVRSYISTISDEVKKFDFSRITVFVEDMINVHVEIEQLQDKFVGDITEEEFLEAEQLVKELFDPVEKESLTVQSGIKVFEEALLTYKEIIIPKINDLKAALENNNFDEL